MESCETDSNLESNKDSLDKPETLTMESSGENDDVVTSSTDKAEPGVPAETVTESNVVTEEGGVDSADVTSERSEVDCVEGAAVSVTDCTTPAVTVDNVADSDDVLERGVNDHVDAKIKHDPNINKDASSENEYAVTKDSEPENNIERAATIEKGADMECRDVVDREDHDVGGAATLADDGVNMDCSEIAEKDNQGSEVNNPQSSSDKDMETDGRLSPSKPTHEDGERELKTSEAETGSTQDINISASETQEKICSTNIDNIQKSPVVVLSKITFPTSSSGDRHEKSESSPAVSDPQDEDSQMSASNKPDDKNDESNPAFNAITSSLVYIEEESQLSRGGGESEATAGTEAEDNNEQEGKGEKTKKKSAKKRRSSVSLIEDNAHITKGFNAEDLFEYQWPQDKTGEWYMLQEQVSEYLEVLSFKRKYPDLTRRPLDYLERIYLKENGVVTEQQCDLGLSPLKSEEVCDLMQKDYPSKYQEYLVVLQQRERQRIKEKHKEYGMQQEQQKNKMDYYLKRAIKSAADFNAQFMKERREERKAYFDLQTFSVHYPKNKYKVLEPSATKPSAYPVALIPGQYQEYYKQYSAEELKYLPLNTVVYGPPKCVKAMGEGEEGIASDTEQSEAASDGGTGSGSSSSGSSDSEELETNQIQQEDDLTPPTGAKCHVCDSGAESNKTGKPEDLVMCAECKRCGHPSCLDLTTEMAPIIKTYPWQCMECKTCVECMDPYDEDKMMFCDHCDRGYHTFCVGLRSIPNGRWECPSCYMPPEPTPKRSRKR